MFAKYKKIPVLVFASAVFVLYLFAVLKYPGNKLLFTLFTLVTNLFLAAGFRKNRIFFDTFLGIYFWVGFWFKSAVRIAFLNGNFVDPIGAFDHSAEHYDKALMVVVCGLSALLLATVIREFFIFKYANPPSSKTTIATEAFYKKYRKPVLALFVFFFVFIALTNSHFGFYQRGQTPRTILPFGLGGLYTWLLFFGLTSFSAVLMNFELKLKHSPYVMAVIGLIETFTSSVSLLSRGMIINAATLGHGFNTAARAFKFQLEFRFKIFTVGLLGVLFIISIFAVTYSRTLLYLPEPSAAANGPAAPLPTAPQPAAKTAAEIQGDTVSSTANLPGDPPADENLKRALDKKNFAHQTMPLFFDRIVGIEGVMAISSYKDLSFQTLKTALNEKYLTYGTSFYDNQIAGVSPYKGMTSTTNHYISLPGIVAFMFYSGSYLFLFFALLVCGLCAAGLELLAYKLSGANVIFCAVISQMTAYRFVHFGYVPQQSYLLFGTMIGNILLIYFLERFLAWRSQHFKP